MSRRSRDNYVSPEWNLGKMQRTLGKICRTAANLDNYSNRMFFWIIIVFSSREEKFFFTCEEKFFFTCEEKFFHTLSLIKGCEEKKSERLENGYCPVEKTMIIQEKVHPKRVWSRNWIKLVQNFLKLHCFLNFLLRQEKVW